MTNNFKDLCNGEYVFRYLARSTNEKIRIFKRLQLGADASGWLGKEQPFTSIAPPKEVAQCLTT